MIKHFILLSLFLFISLGVWSQKAYIPQSAKNRFDLEKENRLQNSPQEKSGPFSEWEVMSNQLWQATLINGGYFTIGTSEGLTESIIDNECLLTFGHPFAMSSYAFPIVNGIHYSPVELMIHETSEVQVVGDSLLYSVSLGECDAQMCLSVLPSGTVRLEYKLWNTTTEIQELGMGLLYDNANGKGDDGIAWFDGQAVNQYLHVTELTQDSIVFWERETSPKGVGYTMRFVDGLPDEMKIGNWQNFYYNEDAIEEIFDLSVMAQWSPTAVDPGDSLMFAIELDLIQPDYNGQLFLRWDMPASLSIENQMLFPQTINTTGLIITEGNDYESLYLETPENHNIIGKTGDPDITVNPEDAKVYQSFEMNLTEVYDSLVIDVELFLKQGETILDRIVQKVFVPASPYSDEGLIVNADTLFLHNDSVVISFNAVNEATGSYLYDLNEPNVFFWEDDTRIMDFDLKKDTSGGTNNADIIFVLDVTGSMGNEIAEVQDNIVEFTDSLTANGINYQLGMVTFLDEIENIYDFTNDVNLFQVYISQQYAHGGGDAPENSLDALMAATQFDFRENSTRSIIWITDERYHEENEITELGEQEVIDALLLQGIVVHCIGTQSYFTDWYEQIVLNTGGAFYDINGNFRDIILEIAQSDANPNYLIQYLPEIPMDQPITYTLEIHYAGLGGFGTIDYDPSKAAQADPSVKVYPNPLSSDRLYIHIEHENAEYCDLELFNMTGQQLLKTRKKVQDGKVVLDTGLSRYVSNDVFILKVSVCDSGNNIHIESINLINN